MEAQNLPHRTKCDTMADMHDEKRGQEILSVFNGAFGELLKGDPSAMSNKFRKMAASAFAFYRGTACLFYHDQAKDSQKDAAKDPFLNDKTSQIWMHGDLHAENFGTYMDSQGRLIFNVNDFDEAYVGPFTWDLKRFVTSIALIGYSKALSDKQIIKLVQHYAKSYRETINLLATSKDHDGVNPFTLGNASGPILEALRSARMQSRVGLLDSMSELHEYERRFTEEGGAFRLDEETQKKVIVAFKKYLSTLPNPASGARRGERLIKDVVGRRGVGIGSAGLPSYNVLLEGGSEALENDVVIYIKQSQAAAVSTQLPHDVAQNHFYHEGHRTVLSQRALQAHADPWLGWTEIDGAGQLVAEVSPYAVDLEWSDINKPEEIAAVVSDLGRATAMMHGAGDDDARHSDLVPFSPEKAIHEAISANEDKFESLLVNFALEYSSQVRKDHHIFVELFRNGQIPGLQDTGEF